MVPGAISTRCSAHERVVQALVVVLGVAAFTAALDPALYSAARDAPGPAWPMWSRWSSVTHPRVSADPGDLAAFEGLVPDVVEEACLGQHLLGGASSGTAGGRTPWPSTGSCNPRGSPDACSSSARGFPPRSTTARPAAPRRTRVPGCTTARWSSPLPYSPRPASTKLWPKRPRSGSLDPAEHSRPVAACRVDG